MGTLRIQDSYRRIYARTIARKWLAEMPVEVDRREAYLAHEIDKAMREYESGLEEIVNQFQKIAAEALGLKLPEPFTLRKKEDE